ncbi:hypothetical protein GT347_15810 [Xylophilus rhododendri]|uniref:Uncharacterized protein n=1 Tax=Xylophilus rhododendri TaxID=2697032 RepID=A0A857J8H0_9BURK|nr:hypothetical protein [Xylophilus rhododendri]QHI99312.1 hypothetical protein GT347_15810 [Xylophilus rhododendri]
MKLNRMTPAGHSIKAFCRCNQVLRQTFAKPLAAHRAIKALWVAGGTEDFSKAIEALKEVPQQYEPECWDAAWINLERLGRRKPTRDFERLFIHMLEQLPDTSGLRLQQLQRAAACLLKHSRDHRRYGKTQWPANQLMCLCAAEPDLPDRLWRKVLHLQGKNLAHGGLFRPSAALVARLPQNRQQEFAILQRCREFFLETVSLQDALELLQRIEGVADPAIRFDLLQVATMCMMRREPDVWSVVSKKQREMLLTLASTHLRQQVLLSMWVDQNPALRRTLLEQLKPLQPLAAAHVLDWQHFAFQNQPEAIAQLEQRLLELLVLSREQHADDHPKFLLALANCAGLIEDQTSRQRLRTLVEGEIEQVGLRWRLPILAALETGTSCVIGVPPSWTERWNRALADTFAALRQAGSAEAAWPLVQALLPALGKSGQRDAALDGLLAALPLLALDDQARVLCQIIERLEREPFCWLTPEHRCRLIEVCGGLPFYLRSAPLEALAHDSDLPPQPGDALLAELQRETDEAMQAWAADESP